MFGLGKTAEIELYCANDPKTCTRASEAIPPNTVVFLCPNLRCPGKKHPPDGRPEARKGESFFIPKTFRYSVPCPHCKNLARIKVCPGCWEDLPVATGNSSTVAIVGTTGSGKTCFVTGLIHQLLEDICREDAFEIALRWNEQTGHDHFAGLSRTIFIDHLVPTGTQIQLVNIPTIQITLRVPVRRWFQRLRTGAVVDIPLLFPDPSGELFQDLKKSYFVSFLRRAEAIILMVDPFLGSGYQARLRAKNLPVPDYLQHSKPAHVALNAIIDASGREGRKLDKVLAVVLTKCDSEGVFNPDEAVEELRPGGRKTTYPKQGGGRYNPALAKRISKRVQQHLEHDLGMADVVALAKQSFRHVAFFAASALGSTPELEDDEYGGKIQRIRDPKPSRTEEPLLWILHQWGYL